MSKEVKRFYIMPGSVPVLLSGDPAYTPMTNHLTDVHTVPLVLASDYDALLAERDALQRALDRQVPLHDAIQRAAGELPEGWEIRLCVEHHAGWVELIGPDGTEDFATNDERLDYTVIDALEHALQGAQP